MKKLIIMRHGKASQDIYEHTDMERPLLPKGIDRTIFVADYFLQKNINIDAIITSPSVRTQQTMQIISKVLNIDKKNIFTEQIVYSTHNENNLYDLIENVDNKYNSLLLIGHNPVLSFLINNYMQPPIDQLPTSGAVGISFDTNDWQTIKTANTKIEFYVFPKMLNNNII